MAATPRAPAPLAEELREEEDGDDMSWSEGGGAMATPPEAEDFLTIGSSSSSQCRRAKPDPPTDDLNHPKIKTNLFYKHE